MSGGALKVVVVYNKANPYGIQKDANLLAEALPLASRRDGQVRIGPVKLMDCREPPVACDVAIHLEVPYAVWFPWARINCILVNGEWWDAKWNSYRDHFDIAMFRDPQSFRRLGNGFRHSMLLKWANSPHVNKALPKVSPTPTKEAGFVWVLGGSVNKRAAAEAVLPLWRESYPPLVVTSAEPLNVAVGANVTLRSGFASEKEFTSLVQKAAGHVCLSRAEGFGYTASEAAELGCFTILNTLPAYDYVYSIQDVAWVPTPCSEVGVADFSNKEALQDALDSAIKGFQEADLDALRKRTQTLVMEQRSAFLLNLGGFLHEIREAFEVRESLPRHMPPLLNTVDCPPISVITLTHNRPKFLENACLNLLHTDYPRDKIEWVVVDDSDPDQSGSNTVVRFQQTFAPGKVTYVPLVKKKSVGAKRNLGVERATNNIILMMDDDDHYPITSFRRRVAWLLKARKRYECAACTTIAMYDLCKGVSAVNVPPYTLGLSERVSEATLTFTRDFWRKKGFADVNIAEGDEFLKGRESQVVEMPPQQIIVALSHNNNLSSRGMPNAGNGCFWGFDRPLLEFLHGLVGIKVEEA